jgi:hypothetical protein
MNYFSKMQPILLTLLYRPIAEALPMMPNSLMQASRYLGITEKSDFVLDKFPRLRNAMECQGNVVEADANTTCTKVARHG